MCRAAVRATTLCPRDSMSPPSGLPRRVVGSTSYDRCRVRPAMAYSPPGESPVRGGRREDRPPLLRPYSFRLCFLQRWQRMTLGRARVVPPGRVAIPPAMVAKCRPQRPQVHASRWSGRAGGWSMNGGSPGFPTMLRWCVNSGIPYPHTPSAPARIRSSSRRSRGLGGSATPLRLASSRSAVTMAGWTAWPGPCRCLTLSV